jgi:hypothetical protein
MVIFVRPTINNELIPPTTAAFKIIKSWLPPKAVDKIKLVDKKSLKDFIPLDQCLASWGGTDHYGFEFEPEVFPSRSDDVRKKVPCHSFSLIFISVIISES